MRRGETPRYLGHNPLGAWSIVAMLVLLLIQAGTGLFANDDILIEGPLYAWVSKGTSDWLTTIHRFNFNLLLLVIAVHLSAVLFYLLVKRENLIRPMLSGRKRLPPGRLARRRASSALGWGWRFWRSRWLPSGCWCVERRRKRRRPCRSMAFRFDQPRNDQSFLNSLWQALQVSAVLPNWALMSASLPLLATSASLVASCWKLVILV